MEWSVEQGEMTLDERLQETARLKHQLRLRDQLVDQLSSELFQMVQEHPPALPQARSPFMAGGSDPADLPALERQISFYQDQLDQRDQQIEQLKTACNALNERNQMLETVIQELPDVYREKFAQKLDQLKEKLEALTFENQQLKGELGYVGHSSRHKKRKFSLPHQG